MGINDFDHIIKDKLSNLEAAPPSHIQENLAFEMHMRSQLAAFEKAPPPHLWEKIAAVIIPETKTVFSSWRLVASIGLIISILSMPMLLMKDSPELALNETMTTGNKISNHQEDNTSVSTPYETPEVETEKTQASASSITEDQTRYSEHSATENTVEYNSTISETRGTTNLANNNTTDFEDQVIEEDITASTKSDNITSKEVINSISEIEIAKITSSPKKSEPIGKEIPTLTIPTEQDSLQSADIIASEKQNLIDSTDQNLGDPIQIGSVKPNPRNLSQFALSIKYAPEQMKVNQDKWYRHGIDFGIHYQNANIIFESGIGGQYTRHNTEYELAYLNHNEFVGTYDSITVGGPTSDHTFDPSQTIHVNIYDTIEHHYIDNATQHLFNIRIPLLVGYQKDFRDYSFFAKGGIMYNLNVIQRTSEIQQPDDVSEVLYLNYPFKTTYKTQIDYMFAVGGNLDISKRLKLTAEFNARYTHYPYFVKETSNGFGLGLRMGVYYEL